MSFWRQFKPDLLCSTNRRKEAVLLGVCLATLLCFHLITLMMYPAPFADEPWHGGRAMAMLREGIPFGQLDQGFRLDFHRYWALFPFLSSAIYAIPHVFQTELHLAYLRGVNLCFGILLLVVMYGIGNRLVGSLFGFCCLLTTGLSIPFLWASHAARPDIMATALAYLAILLYLRNENRSLVWSFCSGLCLGIAFELHPRSCLFGLVLVFLYALDLKLNCIRSTQFWMFVTGTVAGLGLYVALHILPDPESYFSLTAAFYGKHSRTPAVATGRLDLIALSFNDFFTKIRRVYPASWPFALLALFLAPFFPAREKKVVLLAISILIIGGILIRTKMLINLIMLSPALDLLIAAGIYGLLTQRHKLPRFPNLVCCALVCGGVAASIYLQTIKPVNEARPCYDDYMQNQRLVQSVIQPSDTIIGPQVYWLGMQSSNYFAWETLPFYMHLKDAEIQSALEHYKTTVFIVDSQVRPFMSDDNFQETNPWFENLRLPRKALESLLHDHGKLMGTRESKCYGPLEIYRLSLQ